MTASDLLAMLGRQGDENSFRPLLSALGTVASPGLDEEDPYQHYDWVMIRSRGLEVGFADAAYFTGCTQALWRTKGLLLQQMTFYNSGRDGMRRYGGELPHGLQWSDTRSQARTRLAAFETARKSYLTDRWDIGPQRLVLAYASDGEVLDSVHVKLRIAPLDERLRQQPEVTASAWLDLFGHAADSSVLRSALVPLNVSARIELDEIESEVQFTEECGLTLYFDEARRLLTSSHSTRRDKSMVFGAVKFHRARDMNGRQYTGSLPFGLSFEDSPANLADKIGTMPVKIRDGRETGHMLWHLGASSLHVMYSTIENHLFRVMLMAPGFWQDMSEPA